MTTSKRVLVPLKLNTNTDGDLIEWLDSLPEGERNTHIKNALRAFLGKRPVETARPKTNSIDPAALEQLRADLALRDQELGEWLKGMLDQSTRQIEQVVKAAVANLPTTAPGIAADNTDTTPRISPEEKAERRANLAKRKW